MSDDDLIELSRKVDNTLIKWAEQHNVSALSMSAVVMARLLLLCDSLGSGGDFRILCREVSNQQLGKSEEVVH